MKKNLNKINQKLTGSNALDDSINQSWEQDNQAWWDWYVTLADNSNQVNSDTRLDIPSFPNVVLPSKKMIKNELSTPYNLKKKHIDFFRKNGFIKLPNVLSTGAIAKLRKEIIILLKKKFNLDETNRFLSLEMMWLYNKVIREYVISSRIAKIGADLLGIKSIRLYHDNILAKQPGCGRTPWHCDDHHFPLETNDVITVWIPVQAIPREMGPLSFAKPLNIYKMVNKVKFNKFDTTYDKQINEIFKRKNVLIEDGPFNIGEVSFHHNLSFHTAGKNKTNMMRIALANTFYADGAKVINNPTMVSGDWKKFIPGVKPGEIASSKYNPICWKINNDK